MRACLKPHVHKVKGKVNYSLYDLLSGKFYVIKPGDDTSQLKAMLKTEGLTFETKGVVPFKLKPKITDYRESVFIGDLQIKLNGKTENNCWQRKTIKEQNMVMSDDTLSALISNISNLVVGHIRIECDYDEQEKTERIISEIDCSRIFLSCKTDTSGHGLKRYRDMAKERKIEFHVFDRKKFDISKRIVDFHIFFRNQYYNPCLGKKAAISPNGEIKHCLWSNQVLGHVESSNLKQMILNGVFDKGWEAVKDNIEICQDCELRYNCNDCRVFSDGNLNLLKKPGFCAYDPNTGQSQAQK